MVQGSGELGRAVRAQSSLWDGLRLLLQLHDILTPPSAHPAPLTPSVMLSQEPSAKIYLHLIHHLSLFAREPRTQKLSDIESF